MRRAERFAYILDYFRREMPVAETELHYGSPYELLVAVVLSAQCTDKRVNMVTPALFLAYPNAHALSLATEEEVFDLIRSVSYPNSKSRHLVGLAQMLVQDYGGEVPERREELMRLPGVGRKTANVIASVIYGAPTMAVDTHVFRVSERIGLTTRSRTPLQTEEVLIKYIPEADVPRAHHWLILHGRYVCTARSPKCSSCGIAPACRYHQRSLKRTTASTPPLPTPAQD